MGSKLGIILSLFFAIFVFIFSADLITLQANYSNLETIANTVGEMFSKEGGAAFRKINEYLKRQNGVELILEDTTFKYGEFKDFDINEALAMNKGISEYQIEIAASLSKNYRKDDK